jgi:hypothetical protein
MSQPPKKSIEELAVEMARLLDEFAAGDDDMAAEIERLDAVAVDQRLKSEGLDPASFERRVARLLPQAEIVTLADVRRFASEKTFLLNAEQRRELLHNPGLRDALRNEREKRGVAFVPAAAAADDGHYFAQRPFSHGSLRIVPSQAVPNIVYVVFEFDAPPIWRDAVLLVDCETEVFKVPLSIAEGDTIIQMEFDVSDPDSKASVDALGSPKTTAEILQV